MNGGEEEWLPMTAEEAEEWHKRHMAEMDESGLRRYIDLKEERDELKEKARRAVEHDIALEDCPPELRDDRHFYNWYWALFHARKKTLARTRTETAVTAANKGAEIKKAEKAAREERWRNEAAKIVAAHPNWYKDDVVAAIAEGDPDVAAGLVGPNAISRAVRLRNK